MIQITNLSKTYRTNQAKKYRMLMPDWQTIKAVDDVSFNCSPGRIFSLLGPNGAGKTTILRIIATILKPTRGSVEVSGYNTVENALDVRKQIGFITASTGLYDRLTVNELINYFGKLHHINNVALKESRNDLYTMLEMKSFADRKIGELSTGMRQKVSVCRALLHDPEVVIFDEPTVGLDVISTQSIIEIIRKCKTQNKTVIFSTHNMSEVELLSDDLAIIHKGKLLFNDTYESMKKQMKSASLVEEFIRIIKSN